MFRDHDRIDITELETNAVEMLQQVLLRLDQELMSVKQHAKEENKKIIQEYKNRCESGEPRPAVYDVIRSFYKRLINDLTQMQAACSEHRIRGLLDMARETDFRLKPANYKSYAKDLKKIDNVLWNSMKRNDGESTDEVKTYEACACQWTNVPESELEPTQDILKRAIIPRRTAFDMTDLKFKQELAMLRTRIFALPEVIPKRRKVSGFDRDPSLLGVVNAAGSKADFKETDSYTMASVEEEATKIGSLKFVDGQLTYCELWKKLLDACGNQLRSKWLLVLCPQMEAMLKKLIVPSAHFSPEKVFALLSRIEENGATYTLSKEDMLSMLGNDPEAAEWFKGWKVQFKVLAGVQVAATTIQRYWKGYAVRKDIRKSDCKYIAASIIWMTWLFVKKRRYMRARYLGKMLVMVNSTEELNAKLNLRYHETIRSPHVVIHLASLGHPLDIRSSISPAIFRIYQNILALKVSFLRNPNAEVVYVLPVEPSDSLLRMYYDILESVCPNEGIQRRVTFLALSMRNAFNKCSFNTARTLYYSNDTMAAIRAKIVGKSAYILPWVMDECDVWAAGALNVPWVGPSLDLQHRFLNKSHNAELLKNFGIGQPPHSPFVKDYIGLCTNLAELICQHSEICLWLIKINIGIDGNQTGVFLINNVSVPFMPELRKAREVHGEEWNSSLEPGSIYLERLLEHLPKVVFTTTRLTANYKSWKDFYASLVKHGCLVQAVLNEKHSSTVSAAVFIPGIDTRLKPVCIGTADQMHLESQFTAFGFMMPQTSFPNDQLQITVMALAEVLQKIGYSGYASFDLFCYIRRLDDLPIALILDLDLYYSKVHNFLDWFCFTINGRYDADKNSFKCDVNVSDEARKKYYHPASKIVRWDETNERSGIAMGRLHHTQLYRHRWPKLYHFGKKCKISYDAKTRIGSHVAFHDGESRAHVMMTSCNTTMKQCLQMVTANLKNLSKALTIRYKGVVETNIGSKNPTRKNYVTRIRDGISGIVGVILVGMSSTDEKASVTENQVPTYMKFIIGGLAGMSGQSVTHPLDVLKIRMQLSKSGLLSTTKQTIRSQGFLGLYTGLSASLLRQITYTTARLGIFNTSSEFCNKHVGRLDYPTLICLGMMAGMMGALVGTPADVVLVRMIADIQLPPEKRRGYKHAIDGVIRVVKEEGVRTLWTGSIPTMGRAAIANGAQLGTYSRSKMFLKDSGHFEDGLLLQFLAGMMSGIVAATASLPLDIAKTRIQNWKEPSEPPTTGKLLLTIYRVEGARSLWRGFLPYYSRLAPNTVITMVCMDQLSRLYLAHFQS